MKNVIENAVWLGVFILSAAMLAGVDLFLALIIERAIQL